MFYYIMNLCEFKMIFYNNAMNFEGFLPRKFPLAPMLTFPVILITLETLMIVDNERSKLKQDAQRNVYTGHETVT